MILSFVQSSEGILEWRDRQVKCCREFLYAESVGSDIVGRRRTELRSPTYGDADASEARVAALSSYIPDDKKRKRWIRFICIMYVVCVPVPDHILITIIIHVWRKISPENCFCVTAVSKWRSSSVQISCANAYIINFLFKIQLIIVDFVTVIPLKSIFLKLWFMSLNAERSGSAIGQF